MIPICAPTTGHSRGVMIRMVSLMVAVIESEPALCGPLPLAVALVIAALLRQWKVTDKVAPAMTEPAGVPLVELSSAASLAMVEMAPPDGGIGEMTVTASGPLPVDGVSRRLLAWRNRHAQRLPHRVGDGLAVVEVSPDVGHAQREQQDHGQGDRRFDQRLAVPSPRAAHLQPRHRGA